MNTDVRVAKAKRAALIVGTVVPALLIAVSLVLQLSWLPRMPEPAAVHWGIAGLPDGFGSPWQNLLVLTGTNAALLLLPALQILQGRRAAVGQASNAWAAGRRAMPAFVLGMTVSLQTQAIGSAFVQLDAADARDTGSTLGALIGGFVGGVIVGVVGYLAQPKLRIDSEAGEPAADPLQLNGSERAAWVGETGPSRVIAWILGLATAALLVTAVWLFTIEPVGGWIMLGTFLLVGGTLVSCMWFRVRIGSQGFEARSIVGWPVFRVPASDVEHVVTAHISALGEFGGWGLRKSGGRTGLVPRDGEAIFIARRDGRVLVVTLDDAETAAAVLTTAAHAAAHSAEAQINSEGDSA